MIAGHNDLLDEFNVYIDGTKAIQFDKIIKDTTMKGTVLTAHHN
jgi:hypothetical protein